MGSTVTPGISELLARIDEGWRPFRDAVRGIGRARMDEATPAGWPHRELLAHVAAWEDLTARRLQSYRETGDRSPAEEARDVDAFNARVIAQHRLVGAEALLDELDTAHRRLVNELSRLTDEQAAADVHETPFGPASWVQAIVAGSSYGHYAEHASELGLPPAAER